MKKSLAQKIVDAILEDQNDRRGFRHNWEAIDEDVQVECIDSWVKITQKTLDAEKRGE